MADVSFHSDSGAVIARPTWCLGHGTAFDTETPFRIGSITKVFVSALVLKLVEEGKPGLEDKLAALLPDYASRIPQSEKITLRHLLAHTSGIIDPPNQSLTYQTDIVNNPDAMRRLSAGARIDKYVAGKDLRFSPGSDYSYSNAGYWLLAMVAGKVTGQCLPQLMADKLLTPLGLSKTYLHDGAHTDVARSYTVTTPGNVRDVTSWDVAEGNGLAAGGMVSTAGDIHRFYTALFGGAILSPAMLADMQRQQPAGCNGIDCEYGPGLEIWHVGGKTGYGHNGALVGIEANALHFPDAKTTIVPYKNLSGGSDKSFFEKLVK